MRAMPPDDPAVVARLYERLTEALQRTRRDPFNVPVTVAEIYQELVPYRLVRAEIGFDMNADYEHALLRLLGGEGEFVRLEPPAAAEEIRRELLTTNPNVAIYRDYAACAVWVSRPAALSEQRPPAPAAPAAAVSASAAKSAPDPSIGGAGRPAPNPRVAERTPPQRPAGEAPPARPAAVEALRPEPVRRTDAGEARPNPVASRPKSSEAPRPEPPPVRQKQPEDSRPAAVTARPPSNEQRKPEPPPARQGQSEEPRPAPASVRQPPPVRQPEPPPARQPEPPPARQKQTSALTAAPASDGQLPVESKGIAPVSEARDAAMFATFTLAGVDRPDEREERDDTRALAVTPMSEKPKREAAAAGDATGAPASGAPVRAADPARFPEASAAAPVPRAALQAAKAGAQATRPESARCAFCDSALPPQRPARFCPYCGADQATRPCPSCGDAIEPGWVFCITCGATAQ